MVWCPSTRDLVELPYDDRTAAMQAEIAALEERFAAQWLEAIRGLVAEQLPQSEFTRRRCSSSAST